MQCEQFESRLQDLLDRRMHAQFDDHLLAHASHCADCRETLYTWVEVWDGFKLSPRPETSPDFTARVIARVQPAPTAQRWRAAAMTVTALAAMLLVALIPRLQTVFRGGDPSPKTASAPSDNVFPPAAEPRVETRNDELSTSSSFESDSNHPASAVANSDDPMLAVSVNADHWHLLHNFADQIAAVPVNRLEAVEQMPGGLRPVANSVHFALMLLRRTLPGSDPQPFQPSQAQLTELSAMVG